MALRAGYYGLKRRFKDKLESIAGEWDGLISRLTPTKYTVTAAEGVTLGINQVYVTGNTVNVLIRLDAPFDLTSDILVGVIDFKPATDFAFLDILSTSTPYVVLGNALVRRNNGRVEIKKTISGYEGTQLWIKGTYVYSGRVSDSRNVDSRSTDDNIPEIIPQEDPEPITKKRTTKKTVKEGE